MVIASWVGGWGKLYDWTRSTLGQKTNTMCVCVWSLTNIEFWTDTQHNYCTVTCTDQSA